MSAGKYITLDDSLIEQVQQISLIPSEVHEEFLRMSVALIQGAEVTDEIQNLAGTIGVKQDNLTSLLHSAGAILWEFIKGSPSDPSIVSATLRQVGVPSELADKFSTCYRNNKRSLGALKSVLDISHPRFTNLSWRVDMELARRNLSVTTTPKFQLRLDLQLPTGSETESRSIESMHLQSDYANMKRLQKELQLAVDELGSTHCQRITRYIT
mmetsp:Transcript_15412/g.23245  ORF Transcript_15412/g.23245 Transcript_15412/m.23245 type:complete len:212 (-) Transcript_15412:103-738(-)|eukprot:CAMPEP_0185024846 /NCGR_PEP_ID=MMETSP1103-20130426/8036_1 /TAXON_ID=36769 /ORGANISM="Paraphysomonas bandaiensis, Strain Caron Lab Isolate" /LENGTH=211 /DNA_ID=CAMNT_0027557917 /DNA_START=78 /DNA_END=713 /DNA_ORIENTATION=-